MFTAHQFLAKPSTSRTCFGGHACLRLDTLITADELRALAGDVSLLPAAPQTYLAISQALSKPGSGINEVGRIIEREPALCAKVLQIVNSAFFGLPRAVSSITQATNYLGTLALRNLALAMETVAAISRARLPLSNQELVNFQTNSLLVGLLGRRWFAADRRKGTSSWPACLRDMGHWCWRLRGARARPSPIATPRSALYTRPVGTTHNVLGPVEFQEARAIEHEAREVGCGSMDDSIDAEFRLAVPTPSPRALDTEPPRAVGAPLSERALAGDAPPTFGPHARAVRTMTTGRSSTRSEQGRANRPVSATSGRNRRLEPDTGRPTTIRAGSCLGSTMGIRRGQHSPEGVGKSGFTPMT